MERQITCTGLVLVVSLLAAGCAGAGKDNTPVLDFQQAQAVWQAHGIDSYEVTLWQTCFCPPDLLQPMRVTVREGTVIDVEGLEQPINHPDILDPRRLTIDGLLGVIDKARHSAETLVAEYDQRYGFPVRLEVDGSPFIADDEFSYRLSDFQPF